MRDWKAEVRNNLQQFDLSPQQHDEIVTELASHLEEHYEQLLADGLSESEAFNLCIEEASGWRELGKNIRRAKEDVMNHRVKTLWLPSLAVFATASILEMLSLRLGVYQPKVLWKEGMSMVFDIPWLVMLPLCGAIGAHLSWRAGGKQMARLASALSPVIILFAVFCLVLPLSVILDHGFVLRHPMFFVVAIVNSALLPGLLLLLGALPLLIRPTHTPAIAQ